MWCITPLAITPAMILMILSAAHAEPPYDDCPEGKYKACSGDCVPRPNHNPLGATAECRDGTLSHSEHPYSGGTCSHHGGVARILNPYGEVFPNQPKGKFECRTGRPSR